MSQINMSSILKKVEAYTKTEPFQKWKKQKIDDIVMKGGSFNGKAKGGASEAAAKFIEVLQQEIHSHYGGPGADVDYSKGDLRATAVQALDNLEHGAPHKIGENSYQIEIWFANDLHRDSLKPGRYDGIDNIAALLNNGYSADHSVYGIWWGHNGNDPIHSLVERGGAHFIEDAIRNFMGNYASEYGVIDIVADKVYQ